MPSTGSANAQSSRHAVNSNIVNVALNNQSKSMESKIEVWLWPETSSSRYL